MSEERWLPVVGYEGLYEVSDHGRVKSLARSVADRGGRREVCERILKPDIKRKGHLAVTLCDAGVNKPCRVHRHVHRLVLEAFIGPCPDGMEACHFPDRDPANNLLANLRWDTRQANTDDRTAHGTQPRGERNGRAKLDVGKVREIRERIIAGESLRKIAAVYRVSQKTISDIKAGEIWKHVAPAA